MKRVLLTVALAAVTSVALADTPTTKPIRYTWIASSCSTWNCAAAALVLANGDKYVIVLPTGREDAPWVVLKRVEEGSIYVPPEEPYTCEVFADLHGGTARFHALDSCHAPMILNVPDGRTVVTSLVQCGSVKRRATR
jgi:hypothetical protein